MTHVKDNFDIIIVCNYSTLTGIYAINFMKKNKIKFAIEADGAMHKNGNSIKERIKYYLISSASCWFSTSDITDRYFLHYGANKENIFRYPFTSLLNRDLLEEPLSLEEKQKIKNNLGINEEKIILSIGQFIHRKGFDVLINAWRDIPNNAGVYILGGEAPEELIKLRDKMGQNIHFLNFKPKDELVKYYMASDLFVLPTREDIWGLVINEAMAFGLPVITTDKCVAGIELIKDGENGYIVPSEDSCELGKRIKEILNDNCLIEKMGISNLNKIQDYTIENMAKIHLKIFNQIMDRLH